MRNEPSGSNGTARNWSIAVRLATLYSASSFLMLILAAAYLYWSLVKDIERDDSAFASNEILECRRLLLQGLTNNPLLAHEVQTEAVSSQFIKYFVRVMDNRDTVVLETPGMSNLFASALFPDANTADPKPALGIIWRSSAGASYLLMAAHAHAPDAREAKLQLALDVSSDESLVRGYRWKLLGMVALGMLFSCGASVLIARKGLRPLKEITRATEHITAYQLHERIVANGWPVELASLARSFDRMLDRLEDSFKRLSQFSVDLAHELRTPINNLRGEASVALSQSRTGEAYRRTLESSLEEYARLGRLIDNLLFLARAESPTTSVALSRCDARAAVEAVRDYYAALAEDRGVEVRCEGQGVVSADPLLFRQAVSNLLSNALNHTSPGGRVLVRVNRRDNCGVDVSVSDTGCGIASEHLPHIFDRLYRADPARAGHPDGAGLGLAIVKSIMTLHKGRVEAHSEVGRGTTLTLIFPPDQDGAAKANLTGT